MTKNILYLLALAVPLITLGAGCATNDQANSGSKNSNSPGVAVTDTNGLGDLSAVIEPGVTIIKTKTGTSTSATKSYTDALNIYQKSGYRFQFVNCSGIPGTFNIKLGVKFMIDNRDDESHQIGIGTKKYNLAPYDFAVVTVQKIGTYNITCDGGGSAQINVQK